MHLRYLEVGSRFMQVDEQKTSELKKITPQPPQPPQNPPTPTETKTEGNADILYNWMTEVCTKTGKVYEIQVTVHSFFQPTFSLDYVQKDRRVFSVFFL